MGLYMSENFSATYSNERKKPLVVNMSIRQKKKKKKNFHFQNPTNLNFLGPSFRTSKIFSSVFVVFVMIFMLFLYKKVWKKKSAYLTTLKNIVMFPLIHHFLHFF